MQPHNMQDPNRAKEDWILKQNAETESSEHRRGRFLKLFEDQLKHAYSESESANSNSNAWNVVKVLNILVEKVKKKTKKNKIK